MEEAEKILELEFTVLEFHKNHVISQPRDGVILESRQLSDLISVCSDHFGNLPFVYISDRLNDYNVDPTIYRRLDEVHNLAGIAVVSEKRSSLNMAMFQKNFCKLPFEIFTDMEDALDWTNRLLENKK